MSDQTTDAGVLDAIRHEINTAATLMASSWRDMNHVRLLIRQAESSLVDAERELTSAQLAPEGVPTTGFLIRAVAHMRVVRGQSAIGANLALDLEDKLTEAGGSLARALGSLRSLEEESRPSTADTSVLHVLAEWHYSLIAAARPLLRAVHAQLQAAADTATQLRSPNLSEEQRSISLFHVDRGVHHAARSLARADESSQHLDQAMARSSGAARRSLAQADALAQAAQTHSTTSAPSGPRR